jgi:hypothetical protein
VRVRVRAWGRGARPLRGGRGGAGAGAGAGVAARDPPAPARRGRTCGVGWGGCGVGWARLPAGRGGGGGPGPSPRGLPRGGVGQASMGESSSGDPHPRPHRAAAGLHGRWRATYGRAEPFASALPMRRPWPRRWSIGGIRGKACACHARPVACAPAPPGTDTL